MVCVHTYTIRYLAHDNFKSYYDDMDDVMRHKRDRSIWRCIEETSSYVNEYSIAPNNNVNSITGVLCTGGADPHWFNYKLLLDSMYLRLSEVDGLKYNIDMDERQHSILVEFVKPCLVYLLSMDKYLSPVLKTKLPTNPPEPYCCDCLIDVRNNDILRGDNQNN